MQYEEIISYARIKKVISDILAGAITWTIDVNHRRYAISSIGIYSHIVSPYYVC